MSIRINNKLFEETPMNGCHSTVAPNRFKTPVVTHSRGQTEWPHVMSTDCKYRQERHQLGKPDPRCVDCQHP